MTMINFDVDAQSGGPRAHGSSIEFFVPLTFLSLPAESSKVMTKHSRLNSIYGRQVSFGFFLRPPLVDSSIIVRAKRSSRIFFSCVFIEVRCSEEVKTTKAIEAELRTQHID
jgi:hypothetical protein